MIDFNLIKDLKINNQSVTQLQIGQSIIWRRNQPEPVGDYTVTLTLTDGSTQVDTFTNGIIPASKYKGNSNIKSVKIGEDISEIGSYVFSGCTSLTSVNMPENIVVGSSIFANCTNFLSLNTDNDIIYWNYDVLPFATFANCSSIRTVVLGENVKEIKYNCFSGVTYLSDLYCLPKDCPVFTPMNTYTPFGYFRTSGYSSITTYAGSSIASPNFYYIYNGLNYTVNSANTSWSYMSSISRTATGRCYTSDTAYVTSRGYGFTKSKLVPEISTSQDDEYTYINYNIKFSNNTTLKVKTVKIPTPDYNQVSLYLTDGTTQIDTFNNGIITSKKYASNNNIQNVVLGSSIKTIDTSAFTKCNSLETINFNDELININDNAFDASPNITSISLPTQLIKIGNYAFRSSSTFTSITIPDSVTSIANGMFRGCTNAQKLTIGNGITTLSTSAFTECSGLTSVTIGNKVTNLGTYAFSKCSSLKAIYIPNTVTNLGSNATFYGCGLTSVTIPNSVTSIGTANFMACPLTSATIPNSVTSIGLNAFRSCGKLTSVTYLGTIEEWNAITKGTDWKNGVPTSCVVHCTDGNTPI